ncbi:hypothetical protein [Bradyrhizobium prioriisuperbiae]|uniref:hypothetical protein n=1 Tax=Bradyrhizobium prioriisuperbiae TaxID=2854389 RepID=UPI0028EA8CEF|nr:hypothetical protein [Bradyrhizobium prioritasuperba]
MPARGWNGFKWATRNLFYSKGLFDLGLGSVIADFIGALLGRLFSEAWALDRLLGRFRSWLQRLPDRDPSQLPLLHRLGRMLLAAATLACLPRRWHG